MTATTEEIKATGEKPALGLYLIPPPTPSEQPGELSPEEARDWILHRYQAWAMVGGLTLGCRDALMRIVATHLWRDVMVIHEGCARAMETGEPVRFDVAISPLADDREQGIDFLVCLTTFLGRLGGDEYRHAAEDALLRELARRRGDAVSGALQ